MEFEVLDALEDLRYEHKFDEQSLLQCLNDWPQYSKLVEWICAELKLLVKVDEVVNSITTADDLSSFLMELSSLLNELGCPYSTVMEGSLSSRFDSTEIRLIALNFLLSELLASRILFVDKPKQLKIKLDESQEARLLREILQTLGLGKPPENVSVLGLCAKIQERVSQVLAKWKSCGIENSAFFTGVLTPKQWNQLEDLNQQLNSEYKLRREMLLKRLDVTVQSFHWSDRLQSKKEEMNTIFRERRQLLFPDPTVAISDLLAARPDLAIIEKTSSSKYRTNTKSAINSVVIGKVPDRGGRPSEAQVPAPEMPAWQQRQGGGASGSVGWSQPQRSRGEGRGGRGGGFRGGRGGQHDQHQQPAGNQGWEHAGGRSGYQQNQGWERGGGGGSRDYQHDQGGQGQGREQRGDRGGYRDNRGGGHSHGNLDGQQEQYQRGGGRGYGGGRGSRVQGGWSNY